MAFYGKYYATSLATVLDNACTRGEGKECVKRTDSADNEGETTVIALGTTKVNSCRLQYKNAVNRGLGLSSLLLSPLQRYTSELLLVLCLVLLIFIPL